MSNDLWTALADGRVANPDAVMQIRRSIVVEGSAGGMRAIDVRVWGGVDLRILPDRGFDLGQAWFRGIPLAWMSAVGERSPLDNPSGTAWSSRFGGGLLTTCGLRNVGAPSEGHGLHGSYSHLAATDVDVRRFTAEEVAGVAAQATVQDVDSLGHHLRLRRTVRTSAGTGRIDVTDVTENLGRDVEAAPILYHLNFGYPLWSGDARLVIDGVSSTIPRDCDAEVLVDTWREPPPVEPAPERVVEHVLDPAVDEAMARLENPALGIALAVRWRTAELPRLHQWVHPAPGVYVLGVEPANCSVMGTAHDRSEGRLPTLEPGQARETKLSIHVEEI